MAGGEWTDLTAFLAHSDNRYEVRLGFLGLAEPDLNTAEHVARERRHGGALLESMNGGASAWTNTPRYPESVLFSQDEPLHMGGLADQPLAAKLRGMFAVGARLRDVDRRLSFWSGVEAVDWNWRDSTDALVRRWRPSRRMWAISPEAANLTLDWIDTPRKYVSVLLGGGSNSWANVDMAGAFATCVRGEAVVPHIVAGADVQPYGRQDFPEVAELLRPGLEQVILNRNGTAHDPLVRGGGMTVLQGLGKDIHVYGKTGTLAATAGERNNSRFVLAIVRQTGRHIDGGVVLSMVAERADMGTCSEWVGGFLAQHEAWLRARLAAVPAATGPTPAKSRAQRGHGKKAGRGHAGAGA
jgi:hypothetical protein